MVMFGAGEEREYEITQERNVLRQKMNSITELVRRYPNNAELGRHVRQLIKEYTDSLRSNDNT
jgi:hypothetical protein